MPLTAGGAVPPRWRSAHGVDLAGSEGAAEATLLHGWIDNQAALTDQLGLARGSDPATIYEAAWHRWGAATDSHIIGSYCAISALPGGRMRLVRSSWSAPPLHYVCNAERRVASTLLRVIFDAGQPRIVDYDYLADQLLQDHHDGEPRGWYVGVGRVPLGCAVTIGPEGEQLNRYYDPCNVAAVRFTRDEDYVAAARELLDQAAAAALATFDRPGLMLSGGLDSPLVATALLRQLPADRTLPTFTFGPLSDWDGTVGPHHFGEERGFVREFAAMHPRIEPHFPASQGYDFDYRLRDLLALCDVPTANVANVGIFHGPWEAAHAAGCDAMLTADLGNFTISNDAPWFPVEFLRQGKLGALASALAGRPTDSRPLWRKFAALSLLPLLPESWRDRVRALAGGPRDWVELVSLLKPERRIGHCARRAARPLLAGRAGPRSRSEWIWQAWHSADSGEDLDLGFERLHGLRRRDVTAWRPLVEFCLGLPTEQFVKGAEHRRLARRMAVGQLPEAQRCNPRYGLHHPDWHLRLGRRRGDLLAYAERMAAHPQLGALFDFDRMQHLLTDWPEAAPLDPADAVPRQIGLTRAITAAMFVGYAEGRNDL